MTLSRLEDTKFSRKITYGTIRLRILHVFSYQDRATYCGIPRDTALPEMESYIPESDIFVGNGQAIWGDECICPECADTQKYQEELAWDTLKVLP